MDPSSPDVAESPGSKDCHEAAPIDSIKRFGKVQLENQCGHFPFVACLYQLSSKDKILRDRPALDEACLVKVDEGNNFLL